MITLFILFQAEEEEPVCAYPAMTEECKKECTAPFGAYQVNPYDCRLHLHKKQAISDYNVQ
jgi:hypothetical protein